MALFEQSAEYDHLFKMLLVGDSGVGKSCMLLRFVDDTFTQSYISTIGVDFKLRTVEVNGKTVKLQIWDTAGQERFRTITSSYYRGAHAILICYDITDSETFRNVRHWKHEVEKFAKSDAVIMLAGCKKDLGNKRAVTDEEGKQLAETWGALFCETSSKMGDNVDAAFLGAAERTLDNLQAKEPAGAKLAVAPPGHIRAKSTAWAPLLVMDIICFTLGLASLDIGSDCIAVYTYFQEGLYVFTTLGMSLLVLPMLLCWSYLYALGTAKWYELPMYVFQIKTLEEACMALKEGKKTFGLLFINVCEVCFEGFPQSLLSTYNLLVGISHLSSKTFFGMPAQSIFEMSAVMSWMSAAKFLSSMDEYDDVTASFHPAPLPVRLARLVFRFSEVSVRVLSLAFFAAMMRSRKAGSHDNVQVAVWLILGLDYVVMYLLCIYVAESRSNNIVYAGMCVLCAPLHFIREFRKALGIYYTLRILEMAAMVAIVWAFRSADVVNDILGKDTVLSQIGLISGSFFLLALLSNLGLSYFLPADRVSRKSDLTDADDDSGSWLIVPLESRQSSEGYGKIVAPDASKSLNP